MEEKVEKDGKCKAETEVYSRITGYFQAVRGYNPGKKAEFKDRKHYDLGKLALADEDGKRRLVEDSE